MARGITLAKLRKLLSALPGVEEGPCYGTPGFRVKKKLIARLRDDGKTLVVKADFEQRDALLSVDPKTYFVTDHYRGYPYVLVNLERVAAAELAELLEDAWRSVAPKRLLAELDAKADA